MLGICLKAIKYFEGFSPHKNSTCEFLITIFFLHPLSWCMSLNLYGIKVVNFTLTKNFCYAYFYHAPSFPDKKILLQNDGYKNLYHMQEEKMRLSIYNEFLCKKH